MKRVVIESPFAGDFELNSRYLDACILDCLRRGESPYASHGFFPRVLNDLEPEERELGIAAGFAWGEAGDLRVFYVDFGMSSGMHRGTSEAYRLGQEIEVRKLPPDVLELVRHGKAPA